MRAPTVLTSLLVTLGATVVAVVPVGSSTATPSPPTDFHDRWCSTSHPAPCIESVMRGTTPVTPETSAYSVRLTGVLTLDYTDYVMWDVVGNGDTVLSPTDEWTVTLDMGTMKPRYTEGYSKGMRVTRTADGDGTHHVTLTGSPAQMAEGCNDAYPSTCPEISTNTSVRLSGEVWDLDYDGGDAADRNGVDRSQNADTVDDPSYGPTSDGGYQLTIGMANAPKYERFPGDSSPANFVGHAKFRLPYQHFRMRFGVPNPETLPASSVSGTTGGTGAGGTWTITKDESERAFFVGVDGVTFTPTASPRMARAANVVVGRVLRIKRGVITPYAPTNVATKRVTAGRGRVSFTASVARGALPTGYRATCTNLAKTHTRTATAATGPVVVRELRRGVAYDCKVRSLSKAGPGVWSPVKRLAARP